MYDRGEWSTAQCPRCCGKEMETTDHVYIYPKANILWRKLQNITAKWAANNNTAPRPMATTL
eukprot:10394263-Ditylum_brightwellii.AAC.1